MGTSNHHTPYKNDPNGTNFDADVMSAPLAQLDEAITTNADAIAALGSITVKDFWTGTGAEYTALETYDSDTIYLLTSAVA